LTDLEDFRAAKDDFFRDDPQSPLFTSQRPMFMGLRYYPEDPSLRMLLPLDTDVDHEVFDIGTSMGDREGYFRIGRVAFERDGKQCELFLYSQQADATVCFVPFRDSTSGDETYGAGRYLEAHIREDGQVELDFNYAYNPFCAYNENWGCPLPPMENWLMVPIRAGEMAFDHP
jgi:uncharacterized protein